VSYELVVRRNPDGSCTLHGETPERIRVSQELLDAVDPAVVSLDAQGDVMFTLTNAVLWYRRIGPVDDGRYVEFERVA
jgi:hypothetical protein